MTLDYDVDGMFSSNPAIYIVRQDISPGQFAPGNVYEVAIPRDIADFGISSFYTKPFDRKVFVDINRPDLYLLTLINFNGQPHSVKESRTVAIPKGHCLQMKPKLGGQKTLYTTNPA